MFYIIFCIGWIFSFLHNKKIFARIYSVILILVASLRYGFGPDYFAYNYLFEKANINLILEINNTKGSQEIGFRLICSLFKYFGFNYRVLLIVFSTIGIFYIYKTAIEFSKNPMLLLTLYYSFYYFVWTYSALRQGLVLCIAQYYFLSCRKSKKNLKFIIICIILSFIHVSVLVMLLLYCISYFKLNINSILNIIILSLIVSMLPISYFILRLASLAPSFSRLLNYINFSYQILNIFDFQTFGRLFFIFLIIYVYSNYTFIFKDQKVICDIYLLSYALYFFTKFYELTAARLAINGKVFDIILFSNLPFIFRERKGKNFIILIIFLFSSLYFLKELNAMFTLTEYVQLGNETITPYVSIFNKDNFYFISKYILNN